MQVYLYKNLSDEMTINPELTEELALEYTILEPCDMLRPALRITTTEDISMYNYMTIPEFGRSYFMSAPVKYRQGVYELHASEPDDLNNWWSNYSQEDAVIERQEFEYNWYLPDNMLSTDSRADVSAIKIGSSFDSKITVGVIQGGYSN